MLPGHSAIAVEGLSFRYQGRRRPTLQQVSFTVDPGETLLVLGPSGCGKSTLALCLNGLIPHSIAGEVSGVVRVAGTDVQQTPVAELARTVGMVFQDADTQFCMLRVDDEVAFGLENLRVPRDEMPGRIARALDQVGLAGSERVRIDRLSGGARQRLALACVLAMDPSVLVFDEPTSNLDPAGAEDVFAGIASLKASGGRTIVIVEHRLDHVIAVADRVLLLGSEGTIQAFGPTVEVLRRYATGLDAEGTWIPQVSDLANQLIGRGVAVDPYPVTVDQAVDALGRILEASGRAKPVPGLERPGVVTEDRSTTRVPFDARRFPTLPRSRDSLSIDGASHPQAIETSHLSYRYPSGREALRDVTLSIPNGSFFAIVGPNGAGKSTLASHLIGSIRPPPGALRLFGQDARDLTSFDLAALVGYVFQNPEHQFVAATVFDELAFGLRIRRRPESEVKDRVDALLSEFGLSALAKANPFTLSHGEKRRLSVAAMLIVGQRILALDEPTFGQDRKNTAALMELLVRLNEEGRTIVMITHDVRLVAEYARQVAVLVSGSIVFQGSPEELFASQSVLDRGHLVAPPLLEMSRRLKCLDDSFPPVATMARAVEELDRRLGHLPPVSAVGGRA